MASKDAAGLERENTADHFQQTASSALDNMALLRLHQDQQHPDEDQEVHQRPDQEFGQPQDEEKNFHQRLEDKSVATIHIEGYADVNVRIRRSEDSPAGPRPEPSTAQEERADPGPPIKVQQQPDEGQGVHQRPDQEIGHAQEEEKKNVSQPSSLVIQLEEAERFASVKVNVELTGGVVSAAPVDVRDERAPDDPPINVEKPHMGVVALSDRLVDLETRLNASEANHLARLLNEAAVERDDLSSVVPLRSVHTNQIIPGFPVSLDQFPFLTDADVDRILWELDMDFVDGSAQRRKALEIKTGIAAIANTVWYMQDRLEEMGRA